MLVHMLGPFQSMRLLIYCRYAEGNKRWRILLLPRHHYYVKLVNFHFIKDVSILDR